MSLSKNLVVSSSYDVDDWSLVFIIFVVFPGFLRHQGPQFFHIDRWTEKLVKSFVEVPHTNFTKVTWMVFIIVNSVVVLASSISTTTRMLPVFSYTSLSMTDVSSQLPRLLVPCGHVGDILENIGTKSVSRD